MSVRDAKIAKIVRGSVYIDCPNGDKFCVDGEMMNDNSLALLPKSVWRVDAGGSLVAVNDAELQQELVATVAGLLNRKGIQTKLWGA